MAVSDISRVDDLLKALEELGSYEVAVGILSSKGGEILMIANVHEFGINIKVTPEMKGYFRHNFDINLKTPVIRIPERSFIRSSFDSKGPEIFKIGEQYLEQVLDGELSASAFFETIGMESSDKIKEYMVHEVNSPPNSPLTIRNKGSSNPLVASGRLVGSVDYEVRKK